MAQPGLGTRCVQAGYSPKNGEPRQIPIIQSTTFKYESGAEMGKLFDLETSGYFYSRLQNPTNDAVAARIAAVMGGTAPMVTASGRRRSSSRCSILSARVTIWSVRRAFMAAASIFLPSP